MRIVFPEKLTVNVLKEIKQRFENVSKITQGLLKINIHAGRLEGGKKTRRTPEIKSYNIKIQKSVGWTSISNKMQ